MKREIYQENKKRGEQKNHGGEGVKKYEKSWEIYELPFFLSPATTTWQSYSFD